MRRSELVTVGALAIKLITQMGGLFDSDAKLGFTDGSTTQNFVSYWHWEQSQFVRSLSFFVPIADSRNACLCIWVDFLDQFYPNIEHSLLLYPPVNIAEIKFILKGHHNTGDVANMYCLLADAVIPQFVNNQIFW